MATQRKKTTTTTKKLNGLTRTTKTKNPTNTTTTRKTTTKKKATTSTTTKARYIFDTTAVRVRVAAVVIAREVSTGLYSADTYRERIAANRGAVATEEELAAVQASLEKRKERPRVFRCLHPECPNSFTFAEPTMCYWCQRREKAKIT